MQERKKTQIERRAESDTRIIQAAIRNFGRYGYTFSKNADIAKEAGVTSGLIFQRFATKENLFAAAYADVVGRVFHDVDDDATPRECLVSLITQIKEMSDTEPDAFAFCFMLHSAVDYPKEAIRAGVNLLMERNIYRILSKAQEAGMMPKGFFPSMLGSLCGNLFSHIHMCKRYQLEIPGNEYYMQMIGFSDTETERKKRWYRVLETAIANTFEMLTYINIAKNTGEQMRCSQDFVFTGYTDDIRAMLALAVQNNVAAQDREKMLDFLNPDTLSERIGKQKSVSCTYADTRGRMHRSSFIPVGWDRDGRLTEVLAGVYEIKE